MDNPLEHFIDLPLAYCYKCGRPEADASVRCWDCVNADYNRREAEMRDAKSLWKIRDIERAKAEKAEKEGVDGQSAGTLY